MRRRATAWAPVKRTGDFSRSNRSASVMSAGRPPHPAPEEWSSIIASRPIAPPLGRARRAGQWAAFQRNLCALPRQCKRPAEQSSHAADAYLASSRAVTDLGLSGLARPWLTREQIRRGVNEGDRYKDGDREGRAEIGRGHRKRIKRLC